MSEITSKIIDWIENNPWQCIGIAVGFLSGILIILVGFWETLFVLLMVGLGYFLGKGKDEGRPLSERVRDLNLKDRFGRGKEE